MGGELTKNFCKFLRKKLGTTTKDAKLTEPKIIPKKIKKCAVCKGNISIQYKCPKCGIKPTNRNIREITAIPIPIASRIV